MDDITLEKLRVAGREWFVRRRTERLRSVSADILSVHADDAEALEWSWMAEMADGNFDKAAAIVTRRLQAHPECSISHRIATVMARISGRFETAMTHARRAVSLAPTVCANQVELARLHFEAGDIPQSSKHAHEALTCDAANPEPFVILAWCALELGHRDEAKEYIGKLLSLAPDDEFVMSAAGKLLFTMGQRATGLAMLRDVLRMRPADFRVHLTLAHAYIARNDWVTARQYLREALRLKPDMQDVRLLLRMGINTPPNQLPAGWRIIRARTTWDANGHMIHEEIE